LDNEGSVIKSLPSRATLTKDSVVVIPGDCPPTSETVIPLKLLGQEKDLVHGTNDPSSLVRQKSPVSSGANDIETDSDEDSSDLDKDLESILNQPASASSSDSWNSEITIRPIPQSKKESSSRKVQDKVRNKKSEAVGQEGKKPSFNTLGRLFEEKTSDLQKQTALPNSQKSVSGLAPDNSSTLQSNLSNEQQLCDMKDQERSSAFEPGVPILKTTSKETTALEVEKVTKFSETESRKAEKSAAVQAKSSQSGSKTTVYGRPRFRKTGGKRKRPPKAIAQHETSKVSTSPGSSASRSEASSDDLWGSITSDSDGDILESKESKLKNCEQLKVSGDVSSQSVKLSEYSHSVLHDQNSVSSKNKPDSVSLNPSSSNTEEDMSEEKSKALKAVKSKPNEQGAHNENQSADKTVMVEEKAVPCEIIKNRNLGSPMPCTESSKGKDPVKDANAPLVTPENADNPAEMKRNNKNVEDYSFTDIIQIYDDHDKSLPPDEELRQKGMSWVLWLIREEGGREVVEEKLSKHFETTANSTQKVEADTKKRTSRSQKTDINSKRRARPWVGRTRAGGKRKRVNR